MDGPSPAEDVLLPQPVNITVIAKPDSRQMMRRFIPVKTSCEHSYPEDTSIDPLRDHAVLPAAQGAEDLELRVRVEVLRVAQAADRPVAVGELDQVAVEAGENTPVVGATVGIVAEAERRPQARAVTPG